MPTNSSQDAGSVASGVVHPTEPGPEIRRLELLIGRWINEGHLVDEAVQPGSKIVASDVYEWAPGGFFVIHPAYGRIGEVDVGGVEVIGYDPSTQIYWSQFFDSQGDASTSELTLDGEHWIWQGETTRCTSEFSADGKTQTAHHERRNEDGSWVPSMEVVLRKVE
jgi:Protein of unknown function (DUF1579)